MAADIVAQLADSLAKSGVEDGELSYKGQGRKLDDAQLGEYQLTVCILRVQTNMSGHSGAIAANPMILDC